MRGLKVTSRLAASLHGSEWTVVEKFFLVPKPLSGSKRSVRHVCSPWEQQVRSQRGIQVTQSLIRQKLWPTFFFFLMAFISAGADKKLSRHSAAIY